MADETPGRVAATLTAIRALDQAATPGEWKHRTAQTRGDWTSGAKVMPIERVEADARPGGIGIFDASADAEFIATARTAIPRLLAAVEAALKLADRSRGVHWGGRYLGWDLDPADLREAIGAALTGEETGDGD